MTGAVVLNYRTANDTVNCVSRLLDDPQIDQVVVVDNDSGEADRHLLVDELGDVDHVTLHFATHNGGYSAGNNLGLRLLKNRGVKEALVVNPDVVVPVGTVGVLSAALADGTVLACPLLARPDGSVDSNGGWWAYRWGRGELERARRAPSARAGRVRTFAGACFLVDLPQFADLGLLPETHFLYGEEVDVTERMKVRNLRWTLADTTVVHERGGSAGSASAWREKSRTAHRYAAESAVLLARKYWRRWLPIVVLARVVLVLRALSEGHGEVAGAIARGVTSGLRAQL